MFILFFDCYSINLACENHSRSNAWTFNLGLFFWELPIVTCRDFTNTDNCKVGLFAESLCYLSCVGGIVVSIAAFQAGCLGLVPSQCSD